MPFELIRNDITRMHVDAIVNAADPTLLGGGGVDGAIHRAAGPRLLEACRTLGGCETGQAKITRGYDLPCRYVIHTVGPIWHGGRSGEEELLSSCYRTSLALASKHHCRSVTFPLISSGAFGYPRELALRVATDCIRKFLEEKEMTVYLVVYDPYSYIISQQLYQHIRSYIDDASIPRDYMAAERARRFRNTLLPTAAPPEEPVDAAESMDEEEDRLIPPPAANAKLSGSWLPSLPRSREPDLRESARLYESARLDDDLDTYLHQIDESFREMLLRKIDEKRITDAECYKRANIDRKLFNKIKNHADYRPGKPTVLALAISLQLPLSEINEMLQKAGYSLSHSSKFDLIVEYFIKHGNYDIFEINEALFSFDQKLLGSAS